MFKEGSGVIYSSANSVVDSSLINLSEASAREVVVSVVLCDGSVICVSSATD